jgi:hypothetical protein
MDDGKIEIQRIGSKERTEVLKRVRMEAGRICLLAEKGNLAAQSGVYNGRI